MMGLVPVQLSELAWLEIVKIVQSWSGDSPVAAAGAEEITRQLGVIRPLCDDDPTVDFQIILKKKIA